MMASTEPGRKSCRSLSVKRSERSEIQPLAASCAVQMTSPRITSRSPPPACIWVLIWSKRCPVSALPWRKTTLYLPLFCSLNFWTSFRVVPVSSGAEVKTSRVPPPPCCPPPPLHPATPSRAAAASPAPPAFRKSRRESPLARSPESFIRLSFRPLVQQPLMVGVVLDLPLAHGPGHHVEVVQLVARRGRDHVVAPRHQHDVAVVKRQRLVERTILGVDPLQGEAPFRLYPVVVGLLQVPLARWVLRIVLVGRVARPVTLRGYDLDHQQPLRRTVLHQDRMDAPLHVPFTPHLDLDVLGPDEERLRPPLRRRRGDRELQVRHRFDPIIHTGRQIDRVRSAVEHALAPPDVRPLVVLGRDGATPGERYQADLFALGPALDGPARRKPQDLEAHVLPTGGPWGHFHDAAVLARFFLTVDDQVWHEAPF